MSHSLGLLLLSALLGALWGGAACFVALQRSHRRTHEQVADQNLQEKLALQEEVVRQKTVAFRALFEAFAGGAATLDDQGRITGHNSALEARLGLERDELRGRSLLNLVHPQDTPGVQEFLHSLVGFNHAPDVDSPHASAPHSNAPRAVPQFSDELRLYAKNGAIVWVHLSLRPLGDADLDAGLGTQRDTLILALVDDVTRRREAENVAARLSAGVHDLYRVIADQESDSHAQMKSLLSLGCHLFAVRTGLIGKLEGERLEIMAATSPDSRLRLGQNYTLGSESIARRLELPATLRRTSLWDWQSSSTLAQNQSEAFLGSPIYVMGRLAGLLCFADAQTREAPFEAEQLQFCQLMALWIGSEIERRQRQARRDQQAATLQQTNAKWEVLATQDGLTGLKNRRSFDERLAAEWARAQGGGAPFSLLLLDVDQFKGFNDSFGHLAGDAVLQQVARLLQEGVRRETRSETGGESRGESGFVARYGGEEFVILLPGTRAQEALAVGERLRVRLESATWAHRAVTASFGAALWQREMTAPAQLLAAADGALYQSKAAGRNRVTLATLQACS